MLDQFKEATNYIQNIAPDFTPQFGIILGTGLGKLADEVDIAHTLDYADIPHFPESTVEQHHGRLLLGTLEGKSVVVMQGRFHYYEGFTMQEVTFPIRVMKLLGIEKLFVSNAAGGINHKFQLSDLMVFCDHINLQPGNPLIGSNIDELGPRWPDMFDTYDLEMRDQALHIAAKHHIPIHQGVYVSVPGPNLETPAEYKFLEVIGADAVGMSTVPEIIVARHMNIPCFAISVITDLCYPGALEPASIEKIIEAAGVAEPKLTKVFKELIAMQ